MMSEKVSLSLFLAVIFVALAACESPPIDPSTLPVFNDVTGDALTTEKMLRIIDMAKNDLVTSKQRCKATMTVDRVRVQTNPGPLYMLYINSAPCEGSTQSLLSCRVDVLDIRPSGPEVHTSQCPPGPESN